ncbi:MAG: hypothetical protein LBH55_04110 [Mycoplasmataceae bacterium]|jgi:MraZ protein|nr:hypothetical protein [Mycoplasmataceae bacterium]
MFLGLYNHKIDNKNRVLLPAEYIDKLSKKIFITKNDGFLILRTEEDFNDYVSHLTDLSTNDSEMKLILKGVYINSFAINIDASKRILLPKEYKNYITSENNILFVGNGKNIEIWDYFKFKTLNEKINIAFQKHSETEKINGNFKNN